MTRCTTLLVAGVTTLITVAAYGQKSPDGLWTELTEADMQLYQRAAQSRDQQPLPDEARAFRLNDAALAQTLTSAPLEQLEVPVQQREAPATISIPMPDGSFARFSYVESSIMHPDLAIKFPSIKTYAGSGIDTPAATVRFGWTPKGFHAQILAPDGAVRVEPYLGSGTYASYYVRDALTTPDALRCLTEEPEAVVRSTTRDVQTAGNQLRIFRLALACTGEYAVYHGGTIEHAFTSAVTTINNVNAILERDVAARLVFVPNNEQLIFPDPATDPYSIGSVDSLEDLIPLLVQNGETLETIIGQDNYDIGHVLTTAPGGLAVVGSLCDPEFKAGGTSGSSPPGGTQFDLLVAHEIGHQFAAYHTFNGIDGACGDNRTDHSAYEPGSGTTIMSYAGSCADDNVAIRRSPHFHANSIDQMLGHIASTSCAELVSTGNAIPTAEAGANYTIPAFTPFVLTGHATDQDNTGLTYTWEQFDLGPAAALSEPDDGQIPLYGSRPPSLSPARDFTPGSKLPQVTREMTFRFTVRDNNVASGGIGGDETTIRVDGTKGPFQVTSPNSVDSFESTATVTWDVAGTNEFPISAGLVDVLLSTDNGRTFSMLVNDTANDGVQTVSFPPVVTQVARIMVRAEGNIFYDTSNGNFEIQNADFDTIDSDDVSLAIPDLGKITSVIHVPTSMRIEDIDVAVNISHTYISDLVVTLTSPHGTTISLVDRAGGGSNFLNKIFDDEGGAFDSSSRIQPVQPLSTYDALNARGTWTLTIEDTALQDTGTLNSWGLHITSTELALQNPVYVDFNYVGTEHGTISQPFNTLAEGLEAVADGGVIRFVPGTSAESRTILQSVTLQNDGPGPVRIGGATF